MFNLNERNALVTGGTRGLGRAMVLDLAKDCRHVAFTYHRAHEAARSLEKEVQEMGGQAVGHAVDAANPAAMTQLFDDLEREVGVVDLLVNNAGINVSAPLISLNLDDWQAMLNVNLTAPFVTSQRAALGMMRLGRGTVINLSSITGIRGQPAQTGYSATKAGLIGLTKSIAWELAPFGVNVNAIAPGWIEAGMAAAMPEKKKRKAVKSIGLQRFGEAAEVAAAVRYLASPAGRYITGQVLTLDGGVP